MMFPWRTKKHTLNNTDTYKYVGGLFINTE